MLDRLERADRPPELLPGPDIRQGRGKRLVRRADRQIRLFDPPFDKSSLNPGYIKGYVPGVRENG
ncbi:MAG: cyclic beta,2-glucan synthetase, partial [Streptomycetaceae bacterium]|nr:cyclic beta,2-glucan synthetase [Streptomycetaceae bacterium]